MRTRTCTNILLSALAGALTGCSETPKMPRMPWEKPAPAPPATAGHELQGGQVVSVTPVPGTPAGDAEMVRRRVEARQYDEAVADAEAALKKHAGDESAREEILLWIGEAEMGRGNYYEAYERFEKLLGDYPDGRYRERALAREYDVADRFLKGAKRTAMGLLRVSAKDEAVKMLEGIADHAPNISLAQKALLRIADYYYAEKKFSDAVGAYDRCLKLFPKGPQAGHAMLRAARASLALYTDVRYDVSPLKDARQRFRDYQQSFPAEARQQRVEETLATIRLLLAEKLYAIGRYYETTRPSPERRRAAAYYYQQTIQEYPSTIWAERARQGLLKLGVTAPASPGLPRPDRDKEGRTEP